MENLSADMLPGFTPPPDPDIFIWRYMDLPKYISLLSTKCLYFSRADRLGDPFEGSFPQQNIEARKELLRKFMAEIGSEHLAPDFYDQSLAAFSDTHKKLVKSVYVSCWHMNPDESAGMWSIYSRDYKGIAVRSTYRRLISSTTKNINISVVTYIDFEQSPLEEITLFSSFLHKRKSFEHEQELRAVKIDIDHDGIVNGDWPNTQSEGLYIPVDIKQLVEAVYVAPYCDEWYKNLVVDVTSRFGFASFDIKKSQLDKDPYF